MKPVLASKYSSVNQKSRDLMAIIEEHVGADDEFTHADCGTWAGVSDTTVRRRLGPLVSCGSLTVNEETKPYKYKVTPTGLDEMADVGLPDPEKITGQMVSLSSHSCGEVADVR